MSMGIPYGTRAEWEGTTLVIRVPNAVRNSIRVQGDNGKWYHLWPCQRCDNVCLKPIGADAVICGTCHMGPEGGV